MATSFNEQFDQHGNWRREFALRLKLLGEWMKDHDLLDAAVEDGDPDALSARRVPRSRCAYALERCRVEAPPLEAKAQGHTVACWEADRLPRVAP